MISISGTCTHTPPIGQFPSRQRTTPNTNQPASQRTPPPEPSQSRSRRVPSWRAGAPAASWRPARRSRARSARTPGTGCRGCPPASRPSPASSAPPPPRGAGRRPRARRRGARRRRVPPSPMGFSLCSLAQLFGFGSRRTRRLKPCSQGLVPRRGPMWRASSAPSVRTRHVIGGWGTRSGNPGQWEEARSDA